MPSEVRFAVSFLCVEDLILPYLIFSVSTGMKPRPSVRPDTRCKFLKSRTGGKDLRGGGLVLDCRYELHLSGTIEKENIIHEVKRFLSEFDGDEELKEEE